MSRSYIIGKNYLIFVNKKPVVGKLVDIQYNTDIDIYTLKALDGTTYTHIIKKS